MRVHPLIRDTLNNQARTWKHSARIDDEAWEISIYAAETLQSWRAPTSAIAASLIVPLVEFGAISIDALAAAYGSTVINLTRTFIKWKEAIDAPQEKDQPLSSIESALALRELYRHAYRELPDIPFILLLLAYHRSRLTIETSPPTKRAASYTEKVLVPLTQMLGIWSLRREFLERSLTVLCDAYPRMSERLGKAHIYTAKGFAELRSKSKNASTDRKWVQAHRLLIDKAEAYITLEKHFRDICRKQNIAPQPRILPIRPFPGIAVSRIKAGESEEDLVRRLSVRILCHSVEECYRVLGLVHSLGKPIAPKITTHFNDYNYARYNDYIASPLPNGYRALHTAIMYKPNPLSSKDVLTEFRILTPNMHRLNEFGVIAAAHRRAWRYGNVSARWNLSSHPNDGDYYLDKRTQNLITRFELDSCPTNDTISPQGDDPAGDARPAERPRLYVFSPHGEVRLLADKSTALDFAYHIHSELAHHTHTIEVNGQNVPFNYPLKNGDLIRIHYDPHFEGPDISWLGHITTRRARENLRRGLTKRAKSIHVGRAIIHEELDKRLRFYRREKNFNLSITNARLDAFLWGKAQARQCPDLKALYKLVMGRELAPETLLRQLISEELATSVVRANGLPHGYSQSRVYFCDTCRPVPGEEIEAIERKSSMTVHCRDNEKCSARESTGSEPTKLKWVEASYEAKNECIVFNVRAINRAGLLGDVLQKIYDEPAASLHRVEASTYADGSADIMVVLEADSWKRLAELQTVMGKMDGVSRVLSFPPSPSQRLIINTPPTKMETIPYSALDVYDYRFYDREQIVKQLLEWLSVSPPREWMLLHGQKRVGKTSLARYLQFQIIPQHRRDIFPVFIDMLGLPKPFEARFIAEYIVNATYTALSNGLAGLSGIAPPKRQEYEAPMRWMSRALQAACAHLESRRLLMIFDEFAALCHHEETGEMHPSVFDNLRAAMTELRDVNWLLIALDACYRDRERWGNAAQIFNRARPLHITHLDESWARKLIVEPMERCGIKYESEQLVGELFRLTGGNPYFINCVSFDIFEKTRARGETLVTAKTLDEAVGSFLNEGDRHFQQFTEKIAGLRKVILSLVVSNYEKWVSVPDLIAHTQDLLGHVPNSELLNAISSLEFYSILERQTDAEGDRVCIPIDIFYKWLVTKIPIDAAVEEWHAAQHRERSMLQGQR